jgi:hypothetical protein
LVSQQYSGHEADFDEEIGGERKPRVWVSALVCVLLAATGSGSAFLWRGYAGGELMTGSITAAPKAAAAPQAASAAQEALLKSLADGQQRAAAIAQRNQDLLQAQATELKRLSDTVSQLATRVDGLGMRNAQAAVPLPVAKKPAAPKSVAHKPDAPAPLSLAPEGKK